MTDANGYIDVEGLDVGSYHFEETKAPKGYSINTDGKTLTLTVDGEVATAKLYNEGGLNDTNLTPFHPQVAWEHTSSLSSVL